jgi:hypothetical protein
MNDALHAGDAARALGLADQHARAYPNGVLAEERAALRISALCSLGRVREAKDDQARFVAAHPDSPLVRASCAR